MQDQTFSIPQISIQHDWFEELRHDKRKVWLSSIAGKGSPIQHGEIQSSVSSEATNYNCNNGFQANYISKNVLMVKHNPHKVTSYFFNPINSFTKLHTKAIQCLDISCGGGLGLSCGDDGKLFVWQTNDGEVRRVLEGHISDVTHCCFFPSGVVALSGGIDMTLKIWSVADGSCPVTLIGHTAAITDTAIIDRGKNIISCSRDGSVKLWDCGSNKCLSTVLKCSSIINKCCLQSYHSKETSTVDNRNERESGTENKLLLVGTEANQLIGCDICSRNQVFTLPCNSAVNDCCYLDESLIAGGLEDGSIILYDLRNTKNVYSQIQYGQSRIISLKPYPGKSLLVGKGDGSCSCIQTIESSNVVVMELTGSNCDPIYDIALHNNFVYTACRDKIIRKYQMDLNT